jgi:hypothetical protein
VDAASAEGADDLLTETAQANSFECDLGAVLASPITLQRQDQHRSQEQAEITQRSASCLNDLSYMHEFTQISWMRDLLQASAALAAAR